MLNSRGEKNTLFKHSLIAYFSPSFMSGAHPRPKDVFEQFTCTSEQESISPTQFEPFRPSSKYLMQDCFRNVKNG